MFNEPYSEQVFNEKVFEHAPAGHLTELPEWNRQIAMAAAEKEGIELTEEHWEVLHYLRRHFATQGQRRFARLLTQELEEEIAGGRGRRYLYQLFPGGPITQGCRIAGLPAPPFHEDRSFGSVE